MPVTLDDLRRAAGFAPGFWKYLRYRIDLEEAQRQLRERLVLRETNFLHVLRAAIYGRPDSPYLRLLQWAGCEYGDVQRMVSDRGLEPTLTALHQSGVYVTFDEFKGRDPIVRDGRSFAPHPQAFTNPLARPYSFGRSGGSTGPAVQVPRTWEAHRDLVANSMLHYHAHGLIDAPFALWFSTPEIAVQSMIGSAPFRKPAAQWFVPPPETSPWTRRAFLRYFSLAGRAGGVRIPSPRPIGLDDADVVARWAARARDLHGEAMVSGYVSQMVRVAVAAGDAGLDLTGVTMTASGEATTPAKVRRIRASGARFVSEYWSNELGAIGFGCAAPVDGSDLHFQKDRLALIQVPQPVPNSDLTVDAFCFTTLLPSTAMIMLNTELDDFGVFERRPCGCPIEGHGLTEHLRDVRSYRKLTGEGITLVGGEMERIVEDVLPARFGGSALDYQLVEEEDRQGLTRLWIVASPQIEISDESAVVQAVLDGLREGDALSQSTADLWEQARTLRVRRDVPTRTAAGKQMPLHVLRPEPSDGATETPVSGQ